MCVIKNMTNEPEDCLVNRCLIRVMGDSSSEHAI